MLIRFVVENFLSFKDEVEFSMLAGESDEHPDHVHKVRNMRILKTGVIFGANASGKTNLIKAMSFAQNFITSGSLKTHNLELTQFLFDSESAEKPSEFLFEIQCGIAQCFQYYFSVDRQRVHKESLYEIYPNGAKMIFERITSAEGKTHVDFGEIYVLVTNDDDPMDFLPKAGNPRQLFLTQYKRIEDELEEQRIPFLGHIFDWFDHTLVPVFPDSIPTQGIGLGIMRDTEFKDRLHDVLEFLDLGIDGVDLIPIEINAESDLSDELKDYAKRNAQGIKIGSDEKAVFGHPGSEDYILVDSNHEFAACRLVTLHQVNEDGSKIAFNLSAESDGTRRLLELIPTLLGLHSSQSKHVFVIDELDRSIHAHLTGKIIELFLKYTGNRENQLIVTSHDTGLLDLDLLRRDEIWFIEKDRDDASSLYSLEEFRLPEKMNIEKGYLFGRFGAIPVIPSVESQDWIREA